MIKRIVIFTLIISFIFVIGYFLNGYLIEKFNVDLKFPLLSIYIYQAIATVVIYALVELVIEHLPNETGYLYLALMMIKMGIFTLLFKESIFSDAPLSKGNKFSLVIPFFMFLAVEVIAVAKLLNTKDYSTTQNK